MAAHPMASKITNVVMLMLENRSLDNLFGHLYGPAEPGLRFYPGGSPAQFDGIPAGAGNPAFDWGHHIRHYPVQPIPIEQIVAEGRDPALIPWSDPTEEIRSFLGTGHGVINQMFGNERKVSTLPQYGTRARMLGFLQDYWDLETQHPYGGMDILWVFARKQLPYLSTAAMFGAISDAWHSSVPTDTNPNRAFSLCGTSLGRDRNSNIYANETFDVPTIFNGLSKCGRSCGLYYADIWHSHQCFTQYTFPQSTAGLDEVATIDKFFDRAKAGTLPSFTYLEPKWGGGLNPDIEFVQGTDLHPPTSVTPGDQALGGILSALLNSPQWQNMLIIITFDEHGGTWDHVGPRWGAIPPDEHRSRDGFAFNLYGVRVPTILLSPYIPPRTVFRAPLESPHPFDHTSFPASLMDWCGGDRSMFRKRAEAAPAFWDLLSARDEEAADNASAIASAFASPMAPPPAPQPLRTSNAHFEGVAFASARAILKTSRSREEVVRKLEDYRRDPDAFEARIEAGERI